MKNKKTNYFPTKEKALNVKGALKTLSDNQMIIINGGLLDYNDDTEFFDESDDSMYKNYAESTSYSRKTTYAKLRAPK